jgi:hypothetical protein
MFNSGTFTKLEKMATTVVLGGNLMKWFDCDYIENWEGISMKVLQAIFTESYPLMFEDSIWPAVWPDPKDGPTAERNFFRLWRKVEIKWETEKARAREEEEEINRINEKPVATLEEDEFDNWDDSDEEQNDVDNLAERMNENLALT